MQSSDKSEMNSAKSATLSPIGDKSTRAQIPGGNIKKKIGDRR